MMIQRNLTGLFRDLDGFEERHSHDDLETCAAALFHLHDDIRHYDTCINDLLSDS